MKSKLLLTVWLVLVGSLVFLTVYLVQRDPGGAVDTGNTAVIPAQPVPEPGDHKDPGARHPVDPGTTPPSKRTRLQPRLLGRVVMQDGTPVAGADLRVTLPVTTPPAPETASEEDIRFLNSCIALDVIDWDRPRPLRQFLASLTRSVEQRGEAVEVATGTTDGEGQFEIPITNAGLGPFRISADSAVGRATATGMRPGVEIEMTVGPVAKVHGFVYTGNENIGIAGATVVLDDGESRFVGTSGDGGEFSIEGVTPGQYAVSAGAERQPPLLAQPMTVKSGEDLTVRLPRGTLLRVVALFTPDEGDDRPQPDAEVVVLELETLTYVRGKTDANGIVEFRGMPPGSYIVNGRAPRVVSFGEELVELNGQKMIEEAELDFESATDTPLTVQDEAGNPVQGMVFYGANTEEEYDALRSNRLPGQTDARGRYVFQFEFDGPRAQIFGFKAGFAMVRAYPDDPDDGEPITLVARKALHVFGTVRTPDGTPVPNAAVTIEVEPDDEAEVDDFVIKIRTGPDGRYDFPNLPRGDVYISAELEDEDAWSDDLDVELVEGQTEYQKDIELDIE